MYGILIVGLILLSTNNVNHKSINFRHSIKSALDLLGLVVSKNIIIDVLLYNYYAFQRMK